MSGPRRPVAPLTSSQSTPLQSRPARRASWTSALLGTCSPGALLARLAVVAPAAVALGVTLPSPASAQILQLNPEPTQGMNLSIYTPNYISFILPSSSTIGNTQSSGMQSGIYGNAAYTWTLSNSGTIFANFGASDPVTAGVSFLNGGRVTNTGRISGAQTTACGSPAARAR